METIAWQAIIKRYLITSYKTVINWYDMTKQERKCKEAAYI